MKTQVHTICKEGICPLCGNPVEYGDRKEFDDDYVVNWTCTSCGASGQEGYAATFDGQHYNVHDGDGNEVEIMPPCRESQVCSNADLSLLGCRVATWNDDEGTILNIDGDRYEVEWDDGSVSWIDSCDALEPIGATINNHEVNGIADDDWLCDASDKIDDASYVALCALAAVPVEWDMEKIALVNEAIEDILSRFKIPTCHPWENGEGNICYATEDRCIYCKKVFKKENGLIVACNPDVETPLSICDDVLRVDWYNAGEGICGDFDPDNPDDINLLRFDVYVKDGDEWVEVEDASYCTNMPADSMKLQAALEAIFKRYRAVIDGPEYPSVKKLGEELSNISEVDFMED